MEIYFLINKCSIKIRIGRDSFYVNVSMIDILMESGDETLKGDS